MILLKPSFPTQAHHPQHRRYRPGSPAQDRTYPQDLYVPYRLSKERGKRRPNRYNRFGPRHHHRGTLLMGLVTRIGYPINVSADLLLASEPQNGQSRVRSPMKTLRRSAWSPIPSMGIGTAPYCRNHLICNSNFRIGPKPYKNSRKTKKDRKLLKLIIQMPCFNSPFANQKRQKVNFFAGVNRLA